MNEVWAFLQKYLRNPDAALGLGVIFVLALIIIPLPGSVLDGLIAISLVTGVLILLTAMSAGNPAEFSVFPTLLLITTVYRIAVNVSTTRMILSEGKQADSALIQAFGNFVVGGTDSNASIAVGIIIFLILTLVQFLVITKGATRVSEVAARFALDSMPGKQLAIDTDMQAGYISEAEARSRREMLQKEMGFYGAMDGASKFVQGDVRLGLVMVAINIVGGLIVGSVFHGEALTEAFAIYVRFTIGDGLVSTIPALLISTATGVIVTRSVSDGGMIEEIKSQLFSRSRILYVVGGTMILAGLIPGFPMLATFATGGLLIFIGTRIERAFKDKAEIQKQEADSKQGEERKPETHYGTLKTETLEVEFGYNLIQLVDPKANGTLLDQIARLRKRFAMESGLIVPPVRIRDNMNLNPNVYEIRIQGTTVGSASLEPDKLMAIDTGKVKEELEGLTPFKEPTYNLNALWIDRDQKSDAEAAGYDVVDCATVIATHLSKLIQEHSSDIMGRQEVKSIIDSVHEDNPVIVDEVLSEKKIGYGTIQGVLQGLLKEHVSIRNMPRILEAISNEASVAGKQSNLNSMVEAVRQALHRQIVTDYVNDKNTLECITIDPRIDRHMREGISTDPESGQQIIGLRPDIYENIRESISKTYQQIAGQGYRPVFLCSRSIRSGVFYMLERMFPSGDFAVLAHEEIPANVRTEILAQVSMQRPAENPEAVAAAS
ncbi:MAG: FHIPEP family type III secretion protein [Leptospiraceae bacterium]|nr:FHIPEP family type III secretion protein [Leptospiraceae bacterium]